MVVLATFLTTPVVLGPSAASLSCPFVVDMFLRLLRGGGDTLRSAVEFLFSGIDGMMTNIVEPMEWTGTRIPDRAFGRCEISIVIRSQQWRQARALMRLHMATKRVLVEIEFAEKAGLTGRKFQWIL